MSSPASFAVILAASVGAVLLAEGLKRFRVPIVVIEVILGILIGPSVLHWASTGPFISGVADFGLAFLMFMAGYEIDYQRVRGAPLTRATVSWFISFGAALLVGAFLADDGWEVSDLLIGLVLTTTSMGALIPILDDAGVADKPFGAFAFGAGALGEFAPIVAISVLLIGDNPWSEGLWLGAFVVVAFALVLIASRPTPPKFDALISRHLATYGQLPVRVAVLLLAMMLFLAYELGVEALLGSFTAGILFKPMLSTSQREAVEPKLRAIGFGVAIPIFFIVSGMRFDLDSLTDSASSLATVPLFCALDVARPGRPGAVRVPEPARARVPPVARVPAVDRASPRRRDHRDRTADEPVVGAERRRARRCRDAHHADLPGTRTHAVATRRTRRRSRARPASRPLASDVHGIRALSRSRRRRCRSGLATRRLRTRRASPIELLEDAARAAEADAGAALLGHADVVAVVQIVSWPYADPGALLESPPRHRSEGDRGLDGRREQSATARRRDGRPDPAR